MGEWTQVAMVISSILILLCVFLACGSAKTPLPKESRRAGPRHGPLPRAFGSPQNVDPEIDCMIKNLAWEYAKKLIPRSDNHQAVYDAFQLNPACNVPFNSGKTYTPGSLRYDTVPSDPGVEIYVDPKGNPGTESQPVKTINIAVQLMRLKRARLGGDVSGIIYLKPGRYQPKKPINLTPDDSNLAIVGTSTDSTVISGAKEYTLSWKQYTSKNASLEKGVNIVNDTLIKPRAECQPCKFN